MTPTQISWLALEKGTPVFGSDGAEVGKVAEVLGDREKDIFSGISLRPGFLSSKRFGPADLVDEITTDGVKLTISSVEAESRLKPYDD